MPHDFIIRRRELGVAAQPYTTTPHLRRDPVCAVGECEKTLTRACGLPDSPRITRHDLRPLFANTVHRG